MSGTSADGVDGVVLAIDTPTDGVPIYRIHAHATQPYSPAIRARIRAVIAARITAAAQAAALHTELTACYAEVAENLLARCTPHSVAVVGCHGQTVHHRPHSTPPFSLQLGDAAAMARRLSLPVVGDFRAADLAAGGQGAPLAPAFHHAAFADATAPRAIVNIGGIANLTVLIPPDRVQGYDTGPGNTLLDACCRADFDCAYDDAGALARTGQVHTDLLECLLADDYFHRPPPKSTGLEYFNADWLAAHVHRWGQEASPHDRLATATALTARSIGDQLHANPRPEAVYLCGGGVNNTYLCELLAAASPAPLHTTARLQLHPQWVEAAAFAWLAHRTLHRRPSTLPAVTGARAPTIAGVLHTP